MLQAIFDWQISKAEKQLGVPLDYARYVSRISTSAAMRLARFTRIVQTEPARQLHEAVRIAGLAAAMADDCGSCVQIGVNLSRQAGIDRRTIAAVVDQRPEQLSAELQNVFHFTAAVIQNTLEQDDLRERIKQHYGERGLVEICLAVAFHRTFPTLKRGLGFAKSCSRVNVEV